MSAAHSETDPRAIAVVDQLHPDQGGGVAESHPRPVRGWLGWVVSGTIHASVVIVFATWIVTRVVTEKETPPVRLSFIAHVKEPEKPKSISLQPKQPELATIPNDVDVPNPISQFDPIAEKSTTEDERNTTERTGREEAVAERETGGNGAFMAIGAGGSSSGLHGSRRGGTPNRRVGEHGGTPGCIIAVDAGLMWLKRHQDRVSGAWDPVTYPQNCDEDGLKCEAGKRQSGNCEVAMTGYALLCFIGKGYDHRTASSFRPTVRKGVEWLLANQDANGRFSKARNYEHAIAAQALFEIYGMTKDPELREPCEKALKVILDSQAKDSAASDQNYAGLAWDYQAPNANRCDSSVSGWNVMALKSAAAADFSDARAGLAGAKIWMERAWKATNKNTLPANITGESAFPYTWNASTDAVEYGGPNNHHKDLTAVGMACAVFLGHEGGDVMLETMANHALKYQKPTSWATYNSYYTYYNTMGIFQLQGEKWKIWNGAVRDLILSGQRQDDGCFKGSWDPDQGVKWVGSDVGRVLSTCYAILNMEVYYRNDLVSKPQHKL